MPAISALFVLAASLPALAQTPTPDACAAFTWPITDAKQALAGDIPKITSGSAAPHDFSLALAPTEQVPFPVKPERAPKKLGTSGGFVTLDPPKGKMMQATLSDEAWIDVVQNGAYVKSAAFSGKQGCDGVRKVVRFTLPDSAP